MPAHSGLLAICGLAFNLLFSPLAHAQQHLQVIGQWPANARALALTATRAYVTSVEALHIIDISDPSSLTELGRSDQFAELLDVAVQGDYAYVANRTDGVRIFQIVNPSEIKLVATFVTAGTAYSTAVSDHTLIVSDHTDGLYFVDVFDPSAPSLLAFVPAFQSERLAIAGSLLFVTSEWNAFYAYDFSDRHAPLLIGSLSTNETYSVALSGSLAFVVGEVLALQIIDVKDPAAMSSLGHLSGNDTAAVAIADAFAYTGRGPDLNVYDTALPTLPMLITSRTVPTGISQLAAMQGAIWIAGSGGLTSVRALRRGDLDSNGVIDAVDSSWLAKVLSGFDYGPLIRALADVNIDGAATGDDIQAFITRLLD